MWDRWQKGDSLHDIKQFFDELSGSIFRSYVFIKIT